MTTPNDIAAVQRNTPSGGTLVSVKVQRSVRKRIDSLTDELFGHIERDGAMVNGKPHPLIDALTALLAAGTAYRQHVLALKMAGRCEPREDDHR
jgi:hypothetical protein